MQPTRIAEIPIEELMSESWEGTLARLTADMDPWAIDITELAHRYRQYLDVLRELRFDIPGRMVLTCSILLRMKSDDLLVTMRPPSRNEFIETLEEVVAEEAEAWTEPIDVGDDALALPLLRRPRRQVSLDDLRGALAAAMTVSRRRAERLIRRVEEDDDEFNHYQIGGENFADRLYVLFRKIVDLLTGRRFVSFFRLLEDGGDRQERIRRFFEVLHLAADGRISCTQKEFLGDILLSLGDRTD
jgi:chromatin segregation and condensation protein Rec8/ScpA/Scc1 (kleisin family)